MTVHKLPFSNDEAPAVDLLVDGGADLEALIADVDEAPAVDPLVDGGADLEALIADFDEVQRAFKELRRGVFDLHHTLIKRARFHRRAECQLRKLAGSVIEAVNEY